MLVKHAVGNSMMHHEILFQGLVLGEEEDGVEEEEEVADSEEAEEVADSEEGEVRLDLFVMLVLSCFSGVWVRYNLNVFSGGGFRSPDGGGFRGRGGGRGTPRGRGGRGGRGGGRGGFGGGSKVLIEPHRHEGLYNS